MNNVIKKENIENFIFGGNSWFTITSKKTNTHYSYNIYRKHNAPVFFVKIQDGSAHTYSGYIKKIHGVWKYHKGEAGNYSIRDNRILALMWVITHANDADMDTKITLQHMGKCCKCGKALVDPKSIELGVGPKCAKIVFGGK